MQPVDSENLEKLFAEFLQAKGSNLNMQGYKLQVKIVGNENNNSGETAPESQDLKKELSKSGISEAEEEKPSNIQVEPLFMEGLLEEFYQIPARRDTLNDPSEWDFESLRCIVSSMESKTVKSRFNQKELDDSKKCVEDDVDSIYEPKNNQPGQPRMSTFSNKILPLLVIPSNSKESKVTNPSSKSRRSGAITNLSYLSYKKENKPRSWDTSRGPAPTVVKYSDNTSQRKKSSVTGGLSSLKSQNLMGLSKLSSICPSVNRQRQGLSVERIPTNQENSLIEAQTRLKQNGESKDIDPIRKSLTSKPSKKEKEEIEPFEDPKPKAPKGKIGDFFRSEPQDDCLKCLEGLGKVSEETIDNPKKVQPFKASALFNNKEEEAEECGSGHLAELELLNSLQTPINGLNELEELSNLPNQRLPENPERISNPVIQNPLKKSVDLLEDPESLSPSDNPTKPSSSSNIKISNLLMNATLCEEPSLISLHEQSKDKDESSDYLKRLSDIGGFEKDTSKEQNSLKDCGSFGKLHGNSFKMKEGSSSIKTGPTEDFDIASSTRLRQENEQMQLTSLVSQLKAQMATGVSQEALKILNQIEEEATKTTEEVNFYKGKLKRVENFTNSYSTSLNNTSMMAPYPNNPNPNNSSMFDNMMNMLEDLYNAEDMANSVSLYHKFKNTSQLHFCFMFASPLVIIKETRREPVMQSIPWEIEYQTDLKRIKKTLKNAGCDINFLSIKASISSFTEQMKKNPMILHFCGHGIDNNRGLQRLREEYDPVKNYYLLFEDNLGIGELVTSTHLTSMINSSYTEGRQNNNLEFVFVASCHSEIIAHVFLKAGASHVICVAKDEIISDEICQTFAEYYYQAFFLENLTFCEAFQRAKDAIAAVKLFNGEEKKFMMLLRDDVHKNECGYKNGPPENHRCCRFISKSSKEPQFNDLTPTPMFSLPQFSNECFLGRNKEIFEVLDLLKYNRFVTVKGMIGSGKSSLVKAVANRVVDRFIFEHGVIYLDLKTDSTMERLVSVLLSENTLTRLVRKKSGQTKLNQNLEDIIEALTDCEVLIVLDNLDNLLMTSRQAIKSFLEKLITNTKSVRVIITLFSKIEVIQSGFAERVYELGPLIPHYGAQLLLKRATRKIPDSEIEELFIKHPCQLNPWTPSSGTKALLENHTIIHFFKGLPQALLMGGSILHSRSLSELYLLMSGESNRKLNPLINEIGQKEVIQLSLDLTLEIIDRLGEKDNFILASFFPSGVMHADIKTLWGEKYEESLQTFLAYSVFYRHTLSTDESYYTINELLLNHIHRKSGIMLLAKYLRPLLEVYRLKIERYFIVAGTISQAKSINNYNFEEANIREFFKRVKEYYQWAFLSSDQNNRSKDPRFNDERTDKDDTNKKAQNYNSSGLVLQKKISGSHRRKSSINIPNNITNPEPSPSMVSKKKQPSTSKDETKSLVIGSTKVSKNAIAKPIEIIDVESKKRVSSSIQINRAPKAVSKSTNLAKTATAGSYSKPKASPKTTSRLTPLKPALESSNLRQRPSDSKKRSKNRPSDFSSVQKERQKRSKTTSVNLQSGSDDSDEDFSLAEDNSLEAEDLDIPSEREPNPQKVSPKDLEENLPLPTPLTTTPLTDIQISQPSSPSSSNTATTTSQISQQTIALDPSLPQPNLAVIEEVKSGDVSMSSLSFNSNHQCRTEEIVESVESQSQIGGEEDENGTENVLDEVSLIQTDAFSKTNISNIDIECSENEKTDKEENNTSYLNLFIEDDLNLMTVKSNIENQKLDVPSEIPLERLCSTELRNLKENPEKSNKNPSIVAETIADAFLENLPSERSYAQTLSQVESRIARGNINDPDLNRSDDFSEFGSEFESMSTKKEEKETTKGTSSTPFNQKSKLSASSSSQNQAKSFLNKNRMSGGAHDKSKSSTSISVNMTQSQSSYQSYIKNALPYPKKNEHLYPELGEFCIMYCSILILMGRTKEANKEINFLLQVSIVKEDLYLLMNISKLKGLLLFSSASKKYLAAIGFFEVAQTIAKTCQEDLMVAQSTFAIGYMYFLSNELSKSKNFLIDSAKKYKYMAHLFGQLYSNKYLYLVYCKERKEKEAKELRDRITAINKEKKNSSAFIKDQHAKGEFIGRTRGFIISILIEYCGIKTVPQIGNGGFKAKGALKKAKGLCDQYCR